jgi:hypothetical protein
MARQITQKYKMHYVVLCNIDFAKSNVPDCLISHGGVAEAT